MVCVPLNRTKSKKCCTGEELQKDYDTTTSWEEVEQIVIGQGLLVHEQGNHAEVKLTDLDWTRRLEDQLCRMGLLPV